MVSVCIAAYNGQQFIVQQLDSILCQLDNNDEVIISDDGSTDRTIEIIESYKDSRIKLVHNLKSHGVVPNFENALLYTKGDYIFLSDQDDIWMPNKVKLMCEALQKNNLVICDAEIIDADNKLLYPSFYEIRNSGTGFIKNFAANTYLGCCMAFRKDILAYILPFPKKIIMHDIWIGLCVELMGTSIFIHQQLVQYRKHSNSVTSTAINMSNISLYNQIKYRLYFLKNVIKRKIKCRHYL